MSPRRLKSAESEFETLADRSTDDFARQFVSMLRAVVNGDARGLANARDRLARVLAETMTLADLMGRRRLWLEFDAAKVTFEPAEAAAFAASPVVPNVPFREALSDLVTREPRLANTAKEVADLYTNRHAFALARSAEHSITTAVQGFIERSVITGTPVSKAADIIAELGDFTKGYARMAYRTNLSTAWTAGRMQQAREPAVKVALPAFERFSVLDSALRSGRPQDGPKNGVKENHRAAHGLIMGTSDARWSRFAPPSGYGERCGLRLVPIGELRRRGLIEKGQVIPFEPATLSQFQPHPNFGKTRPDFAIYGG